jgi:hypothetical protein
MARSTKRVLLGLVVGAGVVATTAIVLASGRTAPDAASGHTVRAHAPKAASCTQRLLKDWRDGRIDGTYPIACYRRAMKHLPTDVLVYSSAQQDIQRALSERIARGTR